MFRLGVVLALTLLVGSDARADGMEPAGRERDAAIEPVKTSNKNPKKKTKKQRRRARRGFIAGSADISHTPAWQYAQLSADDCLAQLRERGVAFEPEPSPGVLAGVRLTGPLHGVTIRTNQAAARRETSRWEIADCRLVLAMDDFARILAAHDVVEVRHYSMYRPPRKSWPEGKLASQHAGALALDAAIFIRADGSKLDVLDDWHGRIGATTCGDRAKPRKQTPEALALRAILCETAAARLFNVILTPNHNRAHRNHFHLDLTPGARWFIVD